MDPDVRGPGFECASRGRKGPLKDGGFVGIRRPEEAPDDGGFIGIPGPEDSPMSDGGFYGEVRRDDDVIGVRIVRRSKRKKAGATKAVAKQARTKKGKKPDDGGFIGKMAPQEARGKKASAKKSAAKKSSAKKPAKKTATKAPAGKAPGRKKAAPAKSASRTKTKARKKTR